MARGNPHWVLLLAWPLALIAIVAIVLWPIAMGVLALTARLSP